MEAVLEDFSQIKDITKSELKIDYKTTESLLATAHEIFDGKVETKERISNFFLNLCQPVDIQGK